MRGQRRSEPKGSISPKETQNIGSWEGWFSYAKESFSFQILKMAGLAWEGSISHLLMKMVVPVWEGSISHLLMW